MGKKVGGTIMRGNKEEGKIKVLNYNGARVSTCSKNGDLGKKKIILR